MSNPEDIALPEGGSAIVLDILRWARREIPDDSVWCVLALEDQILWLKAQVELLLDGKLDAALVTPYADPNDLRSYRYRLRADDTPGAREGA